MQTWKRKKETEGRKEGSKERKKERKEGRKTEFLDFLLKSTKYLGGIQESNCNVSKAQSWKHKAKP